jgi:hypothetical protein
LDNSRGYADTLLPALDQGFGCSEQRGKIDEATYEAGSAFLVVETGFWIVGKKRMIPAGVVDGIDNTDRKLFVRMTTDEIKGAPDFEKLYRTDRELYDKHYDTYRS